MKITKTKNEKSMDAKEAKQKAHEINIQPYLKEVKEIETLIENSVKEGLYSCSYIKRDSKTIIEPIITHFEDLGFKIKTNQVLYDWWCGIHWG